MKMNKGDLALLVAVLVWFYGFGALNGSCVEHSPDRVLNIACKSACERSHSEMLSVQENVCLCKNLKAMSGDYGQLFLKGE